MKIVRQKFFSEENNNLSNAGIATALLGGAGLTGSSIVTAMKSRAQKKNSKKQGELSHEEAEKNLKASEEFGAKEKAEIRKAAEKARENAKKGRPGAAWFNLEKEQINKFYDDAFDKVMKENHAPVEKAIAEGKKIDKALRKAHWGMGISAGLAAAGAGMYLKGRKKNKED